MPSNSPLFDVGQYSSDNAGKELSERSFKRGMLRFAEIAVERSAQGPIVDARLFRVVESANIGEWLRQTIIPKYNAARVRRFAMILKAEKRLPPSQPAENGGAAYDMQFFQSGTPARQWGCTASR